MDNSLGVQPKHPKQLRKRSSSSSKRTKIKEQQHIKVVYISNPLRVTLSASEFKIRVQELTGQDSGVADYMFDKVLEAPATTTTTTTTTGVGDQLPPTPVAFTADLQMSTSTVSSSGGSGTFNQDGSGGSGTFNQDGSVAGGSAVDFFAEMGALLPEFCGEWELPYPHYDDSFQPFDAA